MRYRHFSGTKTAPEWELALKFSHISAPDEETEEW